MNNFTARFCADPQARKKWMIYGGGGTIFVIVLIIIIAVATSGGKEPVPYTGRMVLYDGPLIDGHNDLPYNIYQVHKNELAKFNFSSDLRLDTLWKDKDNSQTDLPRLKEGMVSSVFWVAYADCSATNKDAVALTLEQIDVIHRLVDYYPNDLKLVTTADGIMEAFWEKKIGSLLGIEGGHSIDSRMSVLRSYYKLGVRYMTLTHDCNTPWADNHLMDKEENANAVKIPGLSEWGKALIKEMNRIGMMVDISHVSKKVMEDVLNITSAPVIFSHSSAYEIYKVTRNVQDDILEKLKTNNGIIMVNFFNDLVTSNSTPDMSHVIEHLNHIKSKIGADHIGIGGDYDGGNAFPKGLEDVSKYPDLFDKLYEGDWTYDELIKLAGGNIIRVLRDVEKKRDELKNEIPYDLLIHTDDLLRAGVTSQCRTDLETANGQTTLAPAITTLAPAITTLAPEITSEVTTLENDTTQETSPEPNQL